MKQALAGGIAGLTAITGLILYDNHRWGALTGGRWQLDDTYAVILATGVGAVAGVAGSLAA